MKHSINTHFSSAFWVFVFLLFAGNATSQDSLFCSTADNNTSLWNSTAWWDPILQRNDLCEGELPVSMTVLDTCGGLQVSYLLFLDTNGDGIPETVINSANPPAPGEVNVNNAYNLNFSGGTPTVFDHRAVPQNQKYRFALERIQNANTSTFKLRWNTLDSQGVYIGAKLPHGKHKITWIVSDSCGNQTTSLTNILLKDCKPPSISCYTSGLSVNIGPYEATPALWVTDFLMSSNDNCTPQSKLRFGIRKKNSYSTGFPYAEGSTTNGNQSISFTCSSLPAFIDTATRFVEVWVMDHVGNASLCQTSILVQDNNSRCSSHGPGLFGKIATEDLEGVEMSNVNLNAFYNSLNYNFNKTFTFSTNGMGDYGFANQFPLWSNVTIQPTLDQDHKNGVTTYDLLLINRHILGLEPMNSPYKMIAADANKSNTITTFDIVELRKLILGVYDVLPNNTSWRFVDKSQQFTNPENPFQDSLIEVRSLFNLMGNSFTNDFVGIKIGDINLSAQANNLMEADDRSAGILLFDIEANKISIEKDEEITVHFKPAEAQLGYQFTLDLDGLEVMEIMPSEGMSEENFAVFEAAITTSVNDAEGAFTVKFRATNAGDLRKMLSVSNRITRAVAFAPSPVGQDDDVETLDIALRFRSPAGMTISREGFEVYQNVPNPWKDQTTIGFNLRAADHVVLTIYDQLGRTVHIQKGDFSKGYNAFVLNKSVVDANKTLYYTINTSTESATKQMVKIK
jgi:hypothetical protein